MKKIIKRIVDILMRCLSVPFFAAYGLLVPLAGRRKAFASVMQTVSLFPGISGEWLRRGVLQWICRMPLTDVCVSFGTLFSDPKVSIANGVYIGSRCDIGKATIGENTIIGSQVLITSGLRQHRFDRTDIPIRDQGGIFERVHIGADTWIGNGAVICADVGKGCVIGAGSIVVKRIPDGCVVAGMAAQVIQNRTNAQRKSGDYR